MIPLLEPEAEAGALLEPLSAVAHSARSSGSSRSPVSLPPSPPLPSELRVSVVCSQQEGPTKVEEVKSNNTELAVETKTLHVKYFSLISKAPWIFLMEKSHS